jgi:SAM-dependent methyltransferase
MAAIQASGYLLRALMVDSDLQWKAWGKTDPYFGVYTDNKFRAENIDRNRAEFFGTGEKSIGIFIDRARKHFGALQTGRALDFGCGVGRLTIPLARRFSNAVGVDISEDMMAEAKRNCAVFQIENAEFLSSDDNLSKVTGLFDLVLSYIVLQHLPLDKGMKLADRLLGMLAPGGVAVLHFTTRRLNDNTTDKIRYWARHNVPQVAAAWRFVRGKGWSTLAMRMTEYEMSDILALFKKHGMADVLVTEHYQENYPGFHFTGRKPAA